MYLRDLKNWENYGIYNIVEIVALQNFIHNILTFNKDLNTLLFSDMS